MFRSFFLLVFSLFYSLNGWANMANPLSEGTLGKVPFTSEHISIDTEKITIVPYGDFSNAKFIIEYYIDSDDECSKLPLIFYASEFEEDFSVWLDGKPITTQPVPDFLHSTFNKNYRYLAEHFSHRDVQATFINDHSSDELTAIEPDVKYFETAISKGKHIIRITYTATYWVDHSFGIREFSFRYALSPAYQWKSYGDLEITLDARNLNNEYKNLYSNLRAPDKGTINTVAYWHYKEIPVDVMMIQSKEYQPLLVRILVYLHPWLFTLFLSAILIYWHAKRIAHNRKHNSKKIISKIALYGSIILPFVVLLALIFYTGFIANITSSDAGYFFLIIVMYPFVMPIYLFIIWLYDWGLQIKLLKKKDAL